MNLSIFNEQLAENQRAAIRAEVLRRLRRDAVEIRSRTPGCGPSKPDEWYDAASSIIERIDAEIECATKEGSE